MTRYHVVVIGGGPGGYTAAIRASQLGFQTALVERENLGGICLNWGCIPTKALLRSAHLYTEIKRAESLGIRVTESGVDFPAIISRSRETAAAMERGVEFLMKKNKVTVIRGTAKFRDQFTVEIESGIKNGEGNGETVSEIQADHFIIAVGARPVSLPGVEMDGTGILGYRQAMTLDELPKSLCVIGGGAIGVEFADFYGSLGTEVTLLEYLPRVLPLEDEEISKLLTREFKKRKIETRTGVRVDRATAIEGKQLRVEWTTGDKQESAVFDKVLSAVGIRANTDGLGVEEIGVRLEKDRIIVDEYYRTTIENIFAVGDCIPGPALAHVAAAEGIRAAEAIKMGRRNSSEYQPLDYNLIPSCTYCRPEVASVGKSEQQALEAGLDIVVGRFPFSASGRARAQGEMTGLVKIVADKKYRQILGAHIIGGPATELISEFVLGAGMELVVENFARTVHPHPTFSEGLMEAAASILGEAINI